MVIFNLKGLLVAIVAVVVFVIPALIGLNVGLCLILGGLAGIYTSIKLTVKGEGYFAMPSVFFIPTHVYTALIVLLGIVTFAGEPSFSQPKKAKDHRVDMVEADQKLLTANKYTGYEDIASDMDNLLSFALVDEAEADELHYLIKKNDGGDKILVMIKFPNIKKFEKDARKEFLSLVEEYISEVDFFDNRELYISIQDERSIWITATPNGTHTSKLLADENDLVDFYGEPLLQ